MIKFFLHICQSHSLRKTSFLLLVLLTHNIFSQELSENYKEFSYAEFFKMIEAEKDTIFKLKDAIIRYNVKTDSLLTTAKYSFMDISLLDPKKEKMVIDKHIELNNILFSNKKRTKLNENDPNETVYFSGYLLNIHFKKTVRFSNVGGAEIYHCRFDEGLRILNYEIFDLEEKFTREKKVQLSIVLGHNAFYKMCNVSLRNNKENISWDGLEVFRNTFYTNYVEGNRSFQFTNFSLYSVRGSTIYNNHFLGNGFITLNLNKLKYIIMEGNTFVSPRVTLRVDLQHESLVIKQNDFINGLKLTLNNLNSSDLVEWKQFNNKIYSDNAFMNYTNMLPDEEFVKINTDSFNSFYKEKLRFQNAEVYAGEAALRGGLYRHYRDNFDMVSANKVYMNLKDFETKRLEYLFDSNPSFDSFFQWKVNQFLKVFSDYGTKPSKAITFSVYVIFVFALIYLFFPNSWDRHGKNRILNRYSFFLKYMNKQAGIHEVYLSDQKEELMGYDEYRKLIKSSDKKVPKFFTSTALPIYKWSISGTKLSAAFLSKIDIMQGTWSELPHHKRFWKSVLLVGAFLVSITYDIFIKIINALMLSINTFTTLGFGEIPIKGLPRYLAIIQGFIGWFMLTIFSVSLISQLLN
ncbi:hypothetical protein [Winogradskyella sp. A3E31]|uniref:hypothetical protein n=1 Tax=Winogradskyella sp. A3E31 TaxID=3349637 RepID=UPI00398B4907